MRFGYVFGSHVSVINTFQVPGPKGRALNGTISEVSDYFMVIREAVH